jgi:hypothetical protein
MKLIENLLRKLFILYHFPYNLKREKFQNIKLKL